MKKAKLNSVLLGSADPERLRTWYREAFAPTVDQNGCLDFDGFGMLIDGRDDVADKSNEPGRVILNLHVSDAEATAEHLRGLGVTWLVEVEEREHGWFGTLIDPDGNYVQIIQFKEEAAFEASDQAHGS